MGNMWRMILSTVAVLLISAGCASVNKGLDTANEGAKEVGKPVGKVISIPGSVAEGAAEGMTEKTADPKNPFNR